MSESTHTVSFALLDDLRFKTFDHKIVTNRDEAKSFVVGWLEKLSDESKYEDLYFKNNVDDFDQVFEQLWNHKYIVWNRLGKYYVVYFSINYCTFDIFSKDYDAKVIDWNLIFPNAVNGPKMGNPLPDDYNVSPVVKMMQQLNTYNTIAGILNKYY